MEQLIQELKEHLIEELNLEEITAEDIDTEAPLFGEGLGLDSIDGGCATFTCRKPRCSLQSKDGFSHARTRDRKSVV